MAQTNITHTHWGRYRGRDVYRFRLENKHGAIVELTNYGATLVAVRVPDRKGTLDNVVLGYDSLEAYTSDRTYMGATIGRFANRIRNARFTLNDTVYSLEANDGANTNHGGPSGLHDRVFDFALLPDGVSFTVTSADGDGGYPGNLKLRVDYTWDDNQALSIAYAATSDKLTIANFTNHAYFNLSGGRENIFNHRLTIKAQQMLEGGAGYLPTGRIIPVTTLAFDDTNVGDRLTQTSEGIKGLNECYVIDEQVHLHDSAACILYDPESGRRLEVYTSYPGVLLYTGDYLAGDHAGHHGRPYRAFDGLCLECQYYPDSPNHIHFPSAVLEAGERYRHEIVFQFGIITS